MDTEGGHVVKRSLLQVDDDQITTVPCGAYRNITDRLHTETGSHCNAQIGFLTLSKTSLQNFLLQRLSKINDRVLQIALTLGIIALTSGHMLIPGHIYMEIAHIFFTTLGAKLKIVISMNFSQILRGNTRLAMKTIDILTNYVLGETSVEHFNHGHVRQRRVSLLHVGDTRLQCLVLFLVLLPVRSFFPTTGTNVELGAVPGPVVRDARGCGDTCTCEENGVVGLEDELG